MGGGDVAVDDDDDGRAPFLDGGGRLKHRPSCSCTRPYRQSRQILNSLSTALRSVWLLVGLLLCMTELSTSTEGPLQPMHLAPYHEKQHRSHSVLDITFPDKSEAFKPLRTFRILTRGSKGASETIKEVSSGMLHKNPKQSKQQSVWQRVVLNDAINGGNTLEASQTSEGGKGGLKCKDPLVCKKFPSGNSIRTPSASGGAIQANIQSLKVIFSQNAASQNSQVSLQQARTLPPHETPSSNVPSVGIEPSLLDWGERPLYSPEIMPLTIINTCNTTFLKIFQLYISDVQFYSTSFEESTISPGEKLDVNITYLPRILGRSNAIIVLETSGGGFLIHAQGIGVMSPYKLPPLVTVILEKGKPFKQNLTLYNPYDMELEVQNIETWPLNPFNRKLYFLCGRGEIENACRQIKDGASTHSIEPQNNPKNCDCSLYEPGPGAHKIQTETYVKLRPLENWRIEPHQTREIATIEVNLQLNESWTLLFHIRLKTTASTAGDENIVIPMEILPQQQTTDDNAQLQFAVQVLDCGVVMERMGLFNSPTHIDVMHENLIDMRACSSGTNELIETCSHKKFEDVYIKQVEYDSSYSALISVGAVSYQANIERQFFTCPQLCRDSGGDLNDFCQRYQKLTLSQKCSSLPCSSIQDVEKRAGLQNLQESAYGQTTWSWDKRLPLLMRLMNISNVSGGSLEFPTTQIGRRGTQYIRVRNPYQGPLLLQLLLYPLSESIECKVSNRDRDAMNMLISDQLGQPMNFRGDISAGSIRQEDKLYSDIFSVSKEAVSYVTLEAFSETLLGPLHFRPPTSCLWSALVIITNNISGMEWLLLQGRGGAAEFTLLDKDIPIQTIALRSDMFYISDKIIPERLFSSKQAYFLNRRSRIHVLSAKNTGNAHLEVFSVKILNGSSGANGLDFQGPQQFSLKAGQRTELSICFDLEPSTSMNNIYLQISTSIGRFNIPIQFSVPMNPFSSHFYVALYSEYEAVILQISILALITVLIIFFRQIMQEMSIGKDPKPVSPKIEAKISVKLKSHLTRTSSSRDMPSSPNKVNSFDHSSQPTFLNQFESAEDVSSSVTSCRKDKIFVSRTMKALVAIVSPLAVLVGSVFSPAKFEQKCVPPYVPNIQLKPELESASSVIKSTKERGSAIARKGPDKRQNHQAIPPAQPVSKDVSLSTPKFSLGHSQAMTNFPESPRASTPRGNRTHEFISNAQPTFAGSPRTPTRASRTQGTLPNQQSPFSDTEPSEKFEKGKRRTRQSNLGVLKQLDRPGSRSGSSSSGSSPASPATPVSPSRSISPLSYAESESKGIRERKNLGLLNSKMVKGSQTGSPLQSKLKASVTSDVNMSNREPEEQSYPLAYQADMVEKQNYESDPKWWSNQAKHELKDIQEVRKEGSYKSTDPQFAIAFEEVVNPSVATKDTNYEELLTSHQDLQSIRRRSKGMPALTTSVTFPGSGRTPSSMEDRIIRNVYPLGAPATSPPERAPGSRLSKSTHLHYYNVQQYEKPCLASCAGCDLDNCSSCGRGSIDGSESSSNPDGEIEQFPNNVEYDMWGNHFAGISQRSRYQQQHQHKSTLSIHLGDPMVDTYSNCPSSLCQKSLNSSDSTVEGHVNKPAGSFAKKLNPSGSLIEGPFYHQSSMISRSHSNRKDLAVESLINHPSRIHSKAMDTSPDHPPGFYTKPLIQSDSMVDKSNDRSPGFYARALNQNDLMKDISANYPPGFNTRTSSQNNLIVDAYMDHPPGFYNRTSNQRNLMVVDTSPDHPPGFYTRNLDQSQVLHPFIDRSPSSRARNFNPNNLVVDTSPDPPPGFYTGTSKQHDSMVESWANLLPRLLTKSLNPSDPVVESSPSLFTKSLNRSYSMVEPSATHPSNLFSRSVNQTDAIVESLANDSSSLFERSLNPRDLVVENVAHDQPSLFNGSFSQTDHVNDSLENNVSSLFSASSHLMHVNHRIHRSVGSSSGSSTEFSMFSGNSFADITLTESSSPKLKLPSTEDVTFASVENLQSNENLQNCPYVIPQKRNRW